MAWEEVYKWAFELERDLPRDAGISGVILYARIGLMRSDWQLYQDLPSASIMWCNNTPQSCVVRACSGL